MKGRFSPQAGLSIAEVVAAVGITAIAGVLLASVLFNSAGLFNDQAVKVGSGLNLNDALSEVRSVIKQAALTDAASNASNLILKVSSVDESGNIIEDVFDTYNFYLENKTLHFKVVPDPRSFLKSKDRVFSTSVDRLYFEYLNSASPPVETTPENAKKIRITLIIKNSSATSEANLRND